jgi:hypothetical protein
VKGRRFLCSEHVGSDLLLARSGNKRLIVDNKLHVLNNDDSLSTFSSDVWPFPMPFERLLMSKNKIVFRARNFDSIFIVVF